MTKNTGNIEILNTLVNNLYDVQKVRIGMSNRNQALEEKDKEEIFENHVLQLKKVERDIVKEMKGQITQFPISVWMLNQRGIGPSLAGQTIAIIRDIGRFDNISRLWSYSGMATIEICTKCGKRHLSGTKKAEWIARIAKRLEDQHKKKKIIDAERSELAEVGAVDENIKDIEDSDIEDGNIEDTNFAAKARKMLCSCENPVTKVTAQRRVKNTIIDYNPKMKKLCRNMALSLIQYNEFYGDMYNGFLEIQLQRDDLLKNLKNTNFKPVTLEKIKRGRAVKMARRKMIKIFLSHIWVQWRKIDGLPVTKPYAFDIQGHSNYIKPPEVDKDEHPELDDVTMSDDPLDI